MTQYTAKKAYIKNADGDYIVPYVNPADDINAGVVTTDYIKNSKALQSGGVSTNSDILADIKNYAHSTFDASKFTVVGSPIVTNDGIATTSYTVNPSGVAYANTNNIKCNFDMTSLSGKSWTIIVPFNTSTNEGKLLIGATDNTTVNYNNTYLQISYSTSLYLSIPTGINDDKNNNYNVIFIPNNSYMNYLGKDLVISLSFDISTGTYTMKLTLADGTIPSGQENNWIQTFTPTTANKELQIINGATSNGYLRFMPLSHCKEDLKGLKIIADGKEVFSGNKTGVDTVKADDYTVVGSPTISADGIASGFSSSNYLTKSITIQPAKSIRMYFKFTTPSVFDTSVDDYRLTGCSADHEGFILLRNTSGLLRLLVGNGSTWTLQQGTSLTLSTNTTYYGYVEWDGSKYTVFCGTNSENISNVLTFNSTTAPYFGSVWIGNSGQFSKSRFWDGSIDLNAFKFYVDGDLVYQPCLKIPYTESKMGSKIVDSIYRDRVQSMYEQEGYAPYYTLSDSDFTLPMGDIYGMMEKINSVDYSSAITSSDINGSSNAYKITDKSFIIVKPADTSSTYTLTVNGNNITAFGYMGLIFKAGDTIYTNASATLEIFKIN